MSSFSVVERLLFYCLACCCFLFGMCGQQEGAETKKVPEFCMMNYGTFYVVVCIYLSDCLFGCKEQ